MHTGAIDILMYHSIAEGPGPTCIAPAIFREHMAALAESAYHTITLATCAAWMRGEVALSDRAVVLTFDDGFDDFARVAFPELQARGWTATVFLPTGKVGGTYDWDAHSPGAPARALMSWQTVTELARWVSISVRTASRTPRSPRCHPWQPRRKSYVVNG